MELVLNQTFTWAKIWPYRNYSQIVNKDEQVKDVVYNESNINQYYNGKTFLMSSKKKNRKTKYFHTTGKEDIDVKISLRSGTRKKYSNNLFVTTKDRHIKAHYGNPFSDIVVTTIRRVVIRNENKLTIKLEIIHRRRDVNWLYFVENRYTYFVSVNTLTGNFTVGNINKSPKGISSNFRKNSFHKVDEMVRTKSLFKVKENYLKKDEHIYPDFKKVFDDQELVQTINKELGINFYSLPNEKNTFLDCLIELFVKLKKIKVNNNYQNWLTNYYPTEKFLKKNDRKLIASILDSYKIKSKITIKLLHVEPTISIVALSKLCYLLGPNYPNYIGSVNIDNFHNSKFNKNSVIPHRDTIVKGYSNHKFYVTDEEKKNIVKLFNSQNNLVNEDFLQLLYDHFEMILKVRKYVPDLIMKATTYDEFHREHLELSKTIQAIKKGWVTEYQFNQQMVDDIQKPIDVKINLGTEENPVYGTDMVGEIKFHPFILKREEEYVEEGSYMHHCVASYSDKERSIIISVRTEDKMDRVTCEYDCQTGKLIQARHFCNKQPPADIELAIEELSKKVLYYARRSMLHSTEKKKVPILVNGVEVIPEPPQATLIETLFNNEVLPY